MSKAVKLEDLQRVAEDGFLTSVRKMLLGEDTVGVTATQSPVLRKITEADWALPEEFGADLSMPADHRWRTTDEDIRLTVRHRARVILPELDYPVIDAVLGLRSQEGLTSEHLARWDVVYGTVVHLHRRVIRGLPKNPGRRRKVHHASTLRKEGPCSAVVTRKPDGRLFVGGQEIDASEVEAYLQPVE